MKTIAVFASGSGSNFQAMIDAVQNGDLCAKLALLICDKPSAQAIDRAKEAGIHSFIFNPKDYRFKEDYEKEILCELKNIGADLLVLAGYMRLIGPTLLAEYQGRIVNIHPSLLPAFPGKDAIGQALEANVKQSGVTIHFVDEGMDTGPIIVQESVTIDESETKDSLQRKIQTIEHRLYPAVLKMLLARGEVTSGKKTRAY
ncbi:MAG: phosphoribosylglycinamide formyltransferase [Neobacillus sp.]|jgi:phosphoribosylglycinamide formyltransferase-1|nr:phosphoribosylglycinamide formyltransferase [Neobacillus sp.]